MKLDRFLKTLDKHAKPGDFELNEDLEIRTPDGICPACKVADWLGLNPLQSKSSPDHTNLRLKAKATTQVIAAADDNEDTPLRRKLLEVCKINAYSNSSARSA